MFNITTISTVEGNGGRQCSLEEAVHAGKGVGFFLRDENVTMKSATAGTTYRYCTSGVRTAKILKKENRV